eukprot:129503-Rhodomonas_salina.2
MGNTCKAKLIGPNVPKQTAGASILPDLCTWVTWGWAWVCERVTTCHRLGLGLRDSVTCGSATT